MFFQIEPEDTSRAVGHAPEIGYRHIDTAQMYGNEKGVGEAVHASGLDRADVFLTSKLHNTLHRPDDARRAFDQTLSELEVALASPSSSARHAASAPSSANAASSSAPSVRCAPSCASQRVTASS